MDPPAGCVCEVCDDTEVMHTTSHSKIIWGTGAHGAATKLGHVMAVPKRHVAEIGELSPEECVDLVKTIGLAARVAHKAWFTASSWPTANLGPQASCNIGFNHGPWGRDHMGEHGARHLHVHVVVRNPFDTNFMWWTTQSSILHLRDVPMKACMLAELARASVACEASGTDSYSVGINVGPHSGASIPSHLHIHVVPRYERDCSVAYWPEAERTHGGFSKPEKVRELFLRTCGEPKHPQELP
eukprot:jgi/Mesen1/6545/ME000334S05884